MNIRKVTRQPIHNSMRDMFENLLRMVKVYINVVRVLVVFS